jgi:MHS family proline/betaine transporter-like MFS transporter
MGSAIVAVLTTALSPEAMDSWGWRVPFWLAGVFGLTGVWMRSGMADSPAYTRVKLTEAAELDNGSRSPFLTLAIRAAGITMMSTVGTYIFLSYMATFLSKYAGLTNKEALWANTIGGILSVIVIPFYGRLSDSVGRKPLLLVCCALFLISGYPLYAFLASKPSVYVTTCVVLYFDLVVALVGATAPAALVEIFPTQVRGRWLTAVYAIVIAVFGGFAPLIATTLIAWSGNPIAPVYYVIVVALVAGLIILRSPETAFGRLK